jgi:dienelactone hydrolase
VKSGANPDKIVVIGYCFGGTGALEAVRGQLAVKGAVSFHGGLGRDTARPITPFTAKILVCHGADDPFVPEQDIVELRKEFKAAYADWQMVYYADAVHSFTDPDAGNNLKSGAAYNDNAAKRSWQHLLVFLKEVL